MNEILKDKLERSFTLTHDLAAHLDERSLKRKLPDLPSNRIGGQIWCIVGARESYMRAIESGGWEGFSCSLKEPYVKRSVADALERTLERLKEMDFTDLTGSQLGFAFDLLEHEVQHHGQLIRFIYGNRLTFPESWHARYTV